MKNYTIEHLAKAYQAGSNNTKEGSLVVNFEEFVDTLHSRISRNDDLFSRLKEEFRDAVVEADLAEILSEEYFVNELTFEVIVNLNSATSIGLYNIYNLFKN